MKDDIQQIKRSMDALVCVLEDWARWQQGYRVRVGYPSHSAGFGSGSGISSFEDMCEASDREMMCAVDSAVNDLPPVQTSAIMRRYGVAAVFRFPRDNFEAALLAAHESLMVTLPRRGVMVGC